MGPFLHIWVDIDITKPLMRGKMIHIEDLEERCVYFKYERLPFFFATVVVYLGIRIINVEKLKMGVFLRRRMNSNLAHGIVLWLQE